MNPVPLLRRWWSAQFVRVAIWSALGLAAVVGGIALSYELALARVPQHRARLERLVRAHTGLDVRFNELNLRWGWYGPEAVFRRVELGEPGRSNVLVRAPELIVGFDAWSSLQSGQLQAGRITLVAPDIDLEHRLENEPDGHLQGRAEGFADRMRVLQRWRGGRIEVEGGTLRLPDSGGGAGALSLQVRRVSVRRVDDQWSASALIYLPERLGYTARLAAQFQGDVTQPRLLAGSARLDGTRLHFAGWRNILGLRSRFAQRLPASGDGDLMVRLAFHDGIIDKADGRVHAQELAFQGVPWFVPTPSLTLAAGAGLALPRLRGEWRLARRDKQWQLRIDDLDLGAAHSDSLVPDVALDIGTTAHTVSGNLGDLPLESLAALIGWLAPQMDLRGVRLAGAAHNVRFEWNGGRAAGARLRASARLDEASFAPSAGEFLLSGLKGSVLASEDSLDLTLESSKAQLQLPALGEHPLENLKVASQLRLIPQGDGWQLATPLLTIDHGATQLILSGTVSKAAASSAAQLDARATLVRADVELVKSVLGASAQQRFGAVVALLNAGRIERAQFQVQKELSAPVSASDPTGNADLFGFSGSAELRDGQVSAGELWPEVHALDARIEWSGARIDADIERASAGSMNLESGQAHWRADSAAPPRMAGRVRGRLEDALQWLTAHPRLEQYLPRLRDLAARGDALFDLDITLPAADAPAPAQRNARAATRTASVRVATLLDAAQLHLTHDLPALEGLRGSLGFDGGRLQRSTLTGRWLGGPVTLRILERRERAGDVLAIQAQGLLEAQQLVSLAGFDALPEVSGEAPWSGELTYQQADSTRSAHWQLDADASLVGLLSHLPEPLAKSSVTAVPLRIDASGAETQAQIDITLGNRLRSQLALLRMRTQSDGAPERWRIERGAVHLGTAPVSLPSEPVIMVHGALDRFDLPGFASLWERAGTFSNVPPLVAELSALQLPLAGHTFADVRIQARKSAGATAELSLQSPELNGSVHWPGRRAEVNLTAQNLDEDERARIVSQLEETWSDSIVTVN